MNFHGELTVSFLERREVSVRCGRPTPLVGRVVRYADDSIDIDLGDDLIHVRLVDIRSVEVR